jgi:hypothetical protein
MILGGTEQQVFQQSLGYWYSNHRSDQVNGSAYSNLCRLAESSRLNYWLQLESEAEQAEVYCRESGMNDTDDLILSLIHRRKA